ncbi:MAG: SusC/RagA family TonB-linked outer membrane protein [Mucilaginibacter sp.]|nr:SusC/RagA family TonB-linked outer membrane protein [Mucilaginibacter sp.]
MSKNFYMIWRKRINNNKWQLKAACMGFMMFPLLLLSINVFAQNAFRINGKVTDEKGEALIGVVVRVVGTNNASTTNSSGDFIINASSDTASLRFTYMGFSPYEVAINRQHVINARLTRASSSLQEVVVIGYGTQRKKDLTGAIAVVDVNSLKAQPAASATEALQGKAAGVNIVNDGSPGSTPQIRIRGYSTINNNDPLYVIDGVPYQGNISWLNQNDIQSMQILKDASAASIYGSRANNGVIIITTKMGKEGSAPRINFDTYYGVAKPITSSFPKFMTPLQYAQYQYQGYKNAGQNPGDYLGNMYGKGENPVLPTYLIAGSAVGQDVTSQDADPSKYSYDPNHFYQITKANQQGTDWMRTITRSAPVQSYQLSASGGGKSSVYAVSAGYQSQDGIVKYTNFKRYNVRANTQVTAFNGHFRFGENALITRTEGVGFSTNTGSPGDGNYENNPINAVYKMQPIIPVYDIAGNFAGAKGSDLGDGMNPLALLYRAKDNYTHQNNIFGNLFGEVDILKDLTARSSLGANLNNFNSQNISYPNLEAPTGSGSNGYSATQGYGVQWTWTNTLKYKHSFGGNTVGLLVGTEAINNSYRTLSGARNGYFLLGDQNYYYLNSGSSNISNAEYGNINTLSSLFGRVDYALKDKYLFSATIRRDGSSNFGSANMYGNFPSFSAAWRLSQEDFLKNIKWLDDLKLRAGYGITGNQNIPANNAINVYQSLNNTSYYPMNGTSSLVSGVSQNQFGNPLLKWEELKSTNLGLDFTLDKNIFDGSIDVYRRVTSGMLFPVSLPSQTVGTANSPYVNAGTMRNQGIELVLNYHYGVASNSPFKFDIGVNFASNANEILALAPGIQDAPYGNFRSLTTTIFRVGQPYGEFYGYKQAGIFQNLAEVNASSQPGARIGGMKFADVDGDGKFTANDRTTLGSPLPKYTLGINTNFTYKNLDLGLFFYSSIGNKIYNINKYYTDFQAFPSAGSTRLLNAWSPANISSNIPSPSSLESAIEYASSSYYVEDGSYFRLKNLQLGYTFKDTALAKKWGFSSFRVYGSVTNVFTITKYSGMDPEITQINQSFNLPGLDFGVYPSPRQFLLGINAKF